MKQEASVLNTATSVPKCMPNSFSNRKIDESRRLC